MPHQLTGNDLPGFSAVKPLAWADPSLQSTGGFPLVQHPSLGTVPYRVQQMPTDPDGQVHQTLGVMRKKVAQAVMDPWFRGWVYSKFGGLDPYTACEAVWEFIKRGIRFQRDEVTGAGIGGWAADDVVEVIISPIDIAQYVDAGVAVGDCDDFSSLVAACLGVLGVMCAFKTVAADGRDPGQFSHVYVMAYPGGMPLAIDASHGPYCGWEVQGYGREQEWASGCDGDNGVLGGFISSVAAVVAGLWVASKTGLIPPNVAGGLLEWT